jgi:hypothetical protein
VTLDEILKDVRNELNEPLNNGMFSNFELTALANRAQDLIGGKIVEADQNFFEQSDHSMAFVASQEEYLLPNLLASRKITRVTRTDLSVPKQLTRIRFQEKEQYHSASVFMSGAVQDADVYYIRGSGRGGSFIGLKPTPGFTYTPVAGVGNLLVHYLQMPHEMHMAVPKSLTSTSFIMPTNTTGAPPIPILQAGRVQTTPNYYVNANIRFIQDKYNSRGAEATITAFNVATKAVTFSPAIDFTDVGYGANDTQYVILSAIPDEFHDCVFQFVLWRAAKKKGDAARAQMAMEMWNTLLGNLQMTIEPRAYDENQHVRAPLDQHLD